jgi:hypothetical protein
LPATLIVNVPSPTAPARFADYLGAWGGDEGWSGAGRNAILVVEDIDETGKATGVFAQGPPTAFSPIRVAAGFSTFTAPVTNDGLTFTRAQLTFTFKRAPGNLMLGHSQGKVDQQPVEFSITLQPISQAEQQRAVAPVDTPRPSSKTVEPRSFDGQWEVDGNGGPSCPIKSWKKVLDIAGHEIRMPGGSPGEISSDGNFQFTSTSPINPAITVSYTGKLQDDAGSGT